MITAYRGEPVTEIGGFRNRVSLTTPGSRQELTVLRDGKHRTLKVTIGELTEEKSIAQGPAHSADEIGLTVQTLTPRLAEQFGARPGEGVVVTQVRSGSIAAMAGIEPGTVILQVNRKAVGSAAEFRHAVKEGSERRRVLLLVRKDDIQRYVVLSW